ncbi:protein-glutamate O-methyltransferase [Tropicimonas sp. TH_r6]|uniref:CheR family methyltransferase n=1 Tax=Tropicimonas sp. TH_r6 TaxID=3082085 RepID=UPI002952F86D|nr:protein-glutamate O-methyltransferase [Tropicimonas sp. TH_r6]MDV7145718.1 protein-glutamate O-methyltransferase [Tropicimonas sp. TH_r6]
MNSSGSISTPSSPRLDTQSLKDFDVLASIAKKEAGLVIPREKAPMVFARITKRLRALKISDRSVYCRMVAAPEGAEERRNLISTLTTNVTSFFREPHHFDTLAQDIMPILRERLRSRQPVRLWSAGCSSGQEPYSIAMTIMENLENTASHDIRILATDIDPNVISTARTGIYDESQISAIPKEIISKFFTPSRESGTPHDKFEICRGVKDLVSFRELNLLGGWPVKGEFDAIFCRNVVIYFDKNSQNSLWPRFQSHTREGGYLFLGHSERIDESQLGDFAPCGTTTYRRTTTEKIGKE